MNTFNAKDSNYVVINDASIHEAMQAITLNHRGCVIVVDKNQVVLGVVSDGDIRRALVKGAIAETPIEKVMNINFLSVKASDHETLSNPDTFFKTHPHMVVPVIDENNVLVGLLVRDGEYKG